MKSRYHGLAKGRIAKRGAMNRTETEFRDQLSLRKNAGEILEYWFEPFSLRLTSSVPGGAQGARYTPDFMILHSDLTIEIVDVKGTGPDDIAGDVRLKAAAELFSLWRFSKAKKRTKKNGGGFQVTEY